MHAGPDVSTIHWNLDRTTSTGTQKTLTESNEDSGHCNVSHLLKRDGSISRGKMQGMIFHFPASQQPQKGLNI